MYVYFVAKPTISHNTILHAGLILLIFNKTYDVATEIHFLDRLADRHEFYDTFLEDGLLQISFLLIAFGLTKVMHQVQEHAAKDELTGLYTRKNFNLIALKTFDVIYFDLNGLKGINDRKGHAVGDLAIVRFSHALQTAANECSSQVFRIGGDEFIVITMENAASHYIDRVEAELQGENLSFSYGVASGTKDTLNQAVEDADKAMYKMKNSAKKVKNATTH